MFGKGTAATEKSARERHGAIGSEGERERWREGERGRGREGERERGRD